jgi:hypothetical protein
MRSPGRTTHSRRVAKLSRRGERDVSLLQVLEDCDAITLDGFLLTRFKLAERSPPYCFDIFAFLGSLSRNPNKSCRGIGAPGFAVGQDGQARRSSGGLLSFSQDFTAETPSACDAAGNSSAVSRTETIDALSQQGISVFLALDPNCPFSVAIICSTGARHLAAS